MGLIKRILFTSELSWKSLQFQTLIKINLKGIKISQDHRIIIPQINGHIKYRKREDKIYTPKDTPSKLFALLCITKYLMYILFLFLYASFKNNSSIKI